MHCSNSARSLVQIIRNPQGCCRGEEPGERVLRLQCESGCGTAGSSPVRGGVSPRQAVNKSRMPLRKIRLRCTWYALPEAKTITPSRCAIGFSRCSDFLRCRRSPSGTRVQRKKLNWFCQFVSLQIHDKLVCSRCGRNLPVPGHRAGQFLAGGDK